MTGPACHHCARLPAQRTGLLWLCAEHAAVLQQTPPCGEDQHQWRGSETPGVWTCWTCGAALTSQDMSTAPVPADVAPRDVW